MRAAEQELAGEADRIRADQEKRIEAEAEKARTAATKAADERVEREVAAAIAASETEARETLRSREQEFDEAVKALSRKYEDVLSFKYTGPWPPYNFVNIKLKLERAET